MERRIFIIGGNRGGHTAAIQELLMQWAHRESIEAFLYGRKVEVIDEKSLAKVLNERSLAVKVLTKAAATPFLKKETPYERATRNQSFHCKSGKRKWRGR